MPFLCLVFVYSSIIIGFISQFFQLIQLEQSLFLCHFEIEIQLLDGPHGFVFQFKREVTWLAFRRKVWLKNLDLINNNLSKFLEVMTEMEHTMNTLGQRQDDLNKKLISPMN